MRRLRSHFVDLLQGRDVVLMDGPMGSRLHQLGRPLGPGLVAANLDRPALVSQVHREYLGAGARVIKTHTFGAGRRDLEQLDLHLDVRAVNRAALVLAREAAADRALVAGGLGPPFLDLPPQEAGALCGEQAALLEPGVDLFVLETFAGPKPLGQAMAAVRQVSAKPVAALVSLRAPGVTLDGSGMAEMVAMIQAQAPAAWGFNCCLPDLMLDTLRGLPLSGLPPLVLAPNAGLPTCCDQVYAWPLTPRDAADFAVRARDLGVKLIGGCCGMGPEHMTAMARALSL